uniref:Uncharacterized protein n=1 Tax=Panagrolaimus davidi TaxID=227884 RepID=A0A914QTT5_9BILA
MATKDFCSSFKDKIGVAGYGTSNGQYNNFNLNQNHQYLNVTSKISKIVSVENKKVQNYDKNYSKAKKDCGNLKKDLSLDYFLNVGNVSEKNDDSDTKSNSTLLLRISAYENSVEGGFTHLIGKGKNVGFKKNQENWNKQLFPSALSMIRNPFEFPRQQEGDPKDEPEVMGFKASQRLLNSNQPAASKNVPLENAIAELSLVQAHVPNVAISVESQQQQISVVRQSAAGNGTQVSCFDI